MKTLKVTINTAGDVILDAKEGGADQLKYTGFNQVVTNGKTGAVKTTSPTTATEEKQAEDAAQYVDMATLSAYDGTNLDKATFEVNGKKFVFIAKGSDTAENLQKLKDAGIEHYVTTAAANAIDKDDVKAMVEKINFETGINAIQGEYTAATGATGAAQK